MKLCWDTAMAIHCCVVCGCFCTTMAKVSSCKGGICLMNPKTFINTISLLTEDICLPDYKQLLWRPWYCCIFRSWEKASTEHVLMCECWVCRQRDPMLLKGVETPGSPLQELWHVRKYRALDILLRLSQMLLLLAITYGWFAACWV